MVLANAMCALNLVSTVMANGVCCYYEMQREEERKKDQDKAIRKAIHDEWERQRFTEMLNRQCDRDVDQLDGKRRIVMNGQIVLPVSSMTETGSKGKHQNDREKKYFSCDSENSTSSTIDVWRKTYDSKNGEHRRIASSRPVDASMDPALARLSSLMDSDDELEEIYIE